MNLNANLLDKHTQHDHDHGHSEDYMDNDYDDYVTESHSSFWNAYYTPPFELEVKKQGFYTQEDFDLNQHPKQFKGKLQMSSRRQEEAESIPEAQFTKVQM